MKTRILLTTVTHFTIRLLVCGQTNPDQTLQNYDSFFHSNIQKLNVSEEESNKLVILNDPTEITKQAEEMEAKAQALRNQAKLILLEATKLDHQATSTKIIASEVAGKLARQRLVAFKQSTDSVIKNSQTAENNVSEVKSLLNEASREIQLAKEMREEAYAWENNYARLGALSNVDEKESNALFKLDEALVILKKMNRVIPAKSEKRILVDIGGLAQQTNTHLEP